MRPHLVRWAKQYADKGLVIIEVDDGRIDALEAVQEHVNRDRPPYAVVYDANGVIVGRYGVMAYPTAYLVDADGKVAWEGHPTPSSLEAVIEETLGL